MTRTITSTFLKLNSNPKNVLKVESFVERIASQFRLPPDTCGNILISVTEAVNNAIIHGNRQDETKFVEVHLSKIERGNKLAIKVCDQGAGFDHTKLKDPTAPENILCCNGRGVYLMRRLSDRVSFSDHGRVVEMEFKL